MGGVVLHSLLCSESKRPRGVSFLIATYKVSVHGYEKQMCNERNVDIE